MTPNAKSEQALLEMECQLSEVRRQRDRAQDDLADPAYVRVLRADLEPVLAEASRGWFGEQKRLEKLIATMKGASK